MQRSWGLGGLIYLRNSMSRAVILNSSPFYLLKGCLTMSGNTFRWHNLWGRYWRYFWCLEAKDAIKLPTVHRPAAPCSIKPSATVAAPLGAPWEDSGGTFMSFMLLYETNLLCTSASQGCLSFIHSLIHFTITYWNSTTCPQYLLEMEDTELNKANQCGEDRQVNNYNKLNHIYNFSFCL